MLTAVISVHDKAGIAEFVRELVGLGFRIISTGGTAKAIREACFAVEEVSDYTGFPEIMDGRVKTLHPKIHGGLLGDPTKPSHMAEAMRYGIEEIHLVCVDLYPIEAEIARADSTHESVLEKVDIGGATLLATAAKGGKIVIADPADRAPVLEWLKAGRPDEAKFLRRLAAKAYAADARHRLAAAKYFSDGDIDGVIGTAVRRLQYGENAWQQPAMHYSAGTDDPLALERFELVAGGEPSYNIVCFLDRTLQTITHIAAAYKANGRPVPEIAVGAKHGNPCGAAVAYNGDRRLALGQMLNSDLLAIHGGFVMVNFEIGEAEADALLYYRMGDGGRRLIDGIAAPSFTAGAVELLRRKKDKCRFLANPALAELGLDAGLLRRSVRGGWLSQPNFTFVPDFRGSNLEVFGRSGGRDAITPGEINKLCLAWAVAATSNSNTISIVQGDEEASWLIGNGVGQMARVHGARLAASLAVRNAHKTRKAAAASDSFFVHYDAVEELANIGVGLIFATSGSVKDGMVREYCEHRGMTLCQFPDSMARGFFGH